MNRNNTSHTEVRRQWIRSLSYWYSLMNFNVPVHCRPLTSSFCILCLELVLTFFIFGVSTYFLNESQAGKLHHLIRSRAALISFSNCTRWEQLCALSYSTLFIFCCALCINDSVYACSWRCIWFLSWKLCTLAWCKTLWVLAVDAGEGAI